MSEHKPHPANVPGDFYVEDGCCTMCEVPFSEAPELFGTVQDPKGYPHCFVKRQPETPAELEGMMDAVRCAELRCIRYRGADRLIQLRLINEGEGELCDSLPPDLQREADRRTAKFERQQREQQRAPGGTFGPFTRIWNWLRRRRGRQHRPEPPPQPSWPN